MVQYNSLLVIIGAIKGTSRDRSYRELSLESLAERRWSRKIIFFHKIFNGLSPLFLLAYISYCGKSLSNKMANQKKLRQFSTRPKISEPSSFPYWVEEWNNRRGDLRKIESTVQFKTKTTSFIRTEENLICKIHDTNDIKLLNCLRLHISHSKEHNFRCNVRATIDLVQLSYTRNNTPLPLALQSLL